MITTRDRAQGVSLAEILPRSRFIGGEPMHVSSCCDNPQHCRPGDLFAALVDQRGDGHEFVDEAIRRGASAILAERHVPVSVPTCVVKDSRAAFARICHALAGDPCEDLHTVGISGTHGKSITSLLIASILETASVSVGVLNSLGYCDGRQFQSTVPELYSAPELARWMASMRDQGCTYAVVEASSANLATRRMEGMALDAAVMTNVRRANMGLHRSVVNYRRAEERLFSLVKPNGFIVANADDPGSKLLLAKVDRPVVTFGLSSPAEVTGEIVSQYHGEQTFLLTIENESIPVRTPIVGRHFIANCLAAAAVTRVLGVDLPTIARGLELVQRIPGRMESVCRGQDFPCYLDVTTTPEGLATVLHSLRKITPGKLICVLGLGRNMDRSDRPRFGRTLERLSDVGIITAGHYDAKLPLDSAHDILDGFDRPAIAHLIPDRTRAVRWAISHAKPGDTVYLSGCNDWDGNCQPDVSIADRDRDLAESEIGQRNKPVLLRFAA